ncbi:hypothetical protein AB0M02_00325 [Actinoplanes sp. NPDC051861]|uniref:hypothetical protein n=1 Tax=Actinoplanes sp. NPDC051861 TaxID=3155170 RepID=UPI0034436736
MTKQQALARAHMIAAQAIRNAMADPTALDHLDPDEALEIKAVVDELEGNHWRTARRLNHDSWPKPESTR